VKDSRRTSDDVVAKVEAAGFVCNEDIAAAILTVADRRSSVVIKVFVYTSESFCELMVIESV